MNDVIVQRRLHAGMNHEKLFYFIVDRVIMIKLIFAFALNFDTTDIEI